MKTKALVSGSFDPVTVGHLDLIRRAAAMYDEVYAVVFNNTEKKYLFDLPTRKEMLTAACHDIPNLTVDTCDGLLAAYTQQKGINVIVRGIRDASDASYEMMLATINRGLGNAPDTIFLPSKPEFFHISSSYVRNMIQYEQPLDGILPPEVISLLRQQKRGKDN